MHLSLFISSFVISPLIYKYHCEAVEEKGYGKDDYHLRVLAPAADPNAAVPELHVDNQQMMRWSHFTVFCLAMLQKILRATKLQAIAAVFEFMQTPVYLFSIMTTSYWLLKNYDPADHYCNQN